MYYLFQVASMFPRTIDPNISQNPTAFAKKKRRASLPTLATSDPTGPGAQHGVDDTKLHLRFARSWAARGVCTKQLWYVMPLAERDFVVRVQPSGQRIRMRR